jgi:hypothetical protein
VDRGCEEKYKDLCQKGMSHSNGTCIHIWVCCLCPWGILFSLFDQILSEGITQDLSGAG